MPIIGEWLRQQSGPARTSGQLPVGSMASGMSVTLPYVAVRGAQPG